MKSIDRKNTYLISFSFDIWKQTLSTYENCVWLMEAGFKNWIRLWNQGAVKKVHFFLIWHFKTNMSKIHLPTHSFLAASLMR